MGSDFVGFFENTRIIIYKAFDSVPIKWFWEAMVENDITEQYINAVKNLYGQNFSRIRDRGRISEPFEINMGLRQGCCLSPTLFKMYLSSVLRKWSQQCKYMGVQIEAEFVYTLPFADDQVLLAQDEDDASYMMGKLIDFFQD